MHACWLVLTHDLLEDRRIDDDSARFKFDSYKILWTNHNSLLSILIWNKKAFFPYVLFRYYHDNTNRFYVAVRLFSNRSQRTSKCGKNISDTLG